MSQAHSSCHSPSSWFFVNLVPRLRDLQVLEGLSTPAAGHFRVSCIITVDYPQANWAWKPKKQEPRDLAYLGITQSLGPCSFEFMVSTVPTERWEQSHTKYCSSPEKSLCRSFACVGLPCWFVYALVYRMLFFDLRMTRHYNMPILSSLNDGQTLSLSWPRTALILLSEAVRTRIALRADVGRCDDAAVKTTRDTRNLWELIIPSKRCCARLPGFKLLSTICGIQ